MTMVDITERRRAEDLIRVQRDLGLAINNTDSFQECLRICVEASIQVSGMDCGGVYLFDEATGGLNLAYHKGLSAGFIDVASRYDADSPNAKLVACGTSSYSRYEDIVSHPSDEQLKEGLRAIAVIPVKHDGIVIACLNVSSHTLNEVPDYSRHALESIASSIGAVIARKQAEKTLRESEERFRNLAEMLPEAVFETDEKGNLTFANDRMAEYFGYEQSVQGTSVFEFIIPEERPRGQEHVLRILSGGKMKPAEYTALRKNGSTFPVTVNSGPVTCQDKIVGTRGVVVDISDRLKREEDSLKTHDIESIGVRAGGTTHDFDPAIKTEESAKMTKEEGIVENSVRILVMDDEEVIRGLYRKILNRFGHQVDCAKDGTEAVRLFREARVSGYCYDIVILDLITEAGMGGVETLARLREIDPGVKAIVCSGYSENSVMTDSTLYGFEAVLTKPFKPAELDRAVRKVLRTDVVPAQR